MAAIYYKQPNGRYCRYSTIVDCVTDYNMTEDDILKLFVERAIDDARNFIKNEKNFREFEELTKKYEDLAPGEKPAGEMTVDEFNCIKEYMSQKENNFTIWTRV